ncbi:hypothetical protein VE04_05797 [Pseudogymnoascus sp. 24MN13]|nr:hypothetical protein VE04_05797 [Pseudogymnoascus sp. 24MN13]
MANSKPTDFDVVIIGAGISGINAAKRVQTALPGCIYTILESRGTIGGTWDLFQYPGIRSDSDLYTFGFPWRPWLEKKSIADGASIKKYMVESAAEYDIGKHIQFHHKLVGADWSSTNQSWSLTVDANGEKRHLRGRFLIFGAGYYDYEVPLEANIPGIDNFKGTKIHPQFWPEDLDWSGKKIVIIGSGATAVTLLPNLADKALKVTILQRSPTYVITRPSVDSWEWFLRSFFPAFIANRAVRIKNLLELFLMFHFCRAFPSMATALIKDATEKELPNSIPHDPNFKPSYNPWEQRLCICPDGDFYEALRKGNGDIVTDTIRTVTETGILTAGGKTLDADIIVTATGLKMTFAGGSMVSINGIPVKFSDKYMWKGSLVQDLPNAAFVMGYTNASWTLGADATAQLVCRIMRYMKSKGIATVTPRVQDDSEIHSESIMNLKSTYIREGLNVLPKGGDVGPWKRRSNYFMDLWNAKFGGFSGLEFKNSSDPLRID